MLQAVFLTEDFYNAHADHNEIEKKELRPYIRIQIVVDGVLWGIPLRSHIAHGHVIWTNKDDGCGIDFTKAVVIEKPDQYISAVKPHIRSEEFKVLKRIDEYQVAQKLQRYINDYKKAKAHMNIPRNRQLVEFSTLQYFEKYI